MKEYAIVISDVQRTSKVDEEDQKGIEGINLAEQPLEIKEDVEDAAPLHEEL